MTEKLLTEALRIQSNKICLNVELSRILSSIDTDVETRRIKLGVALDTVIYGVQVHFSETFLKTESGFVFFSLFWENNPTSRIRKFLCHFIQNRGKFTMYFLDKTRKQIFGSRNCIVE